MAPQRYVHCELCDQSFYSDAGDCCTLCRKLGGLLDVPEPLMSLYDHSRASSAGRSLKDHGGAITVGFAIGFVVLMAAIIAVGTGFTWLLSGLGHCCSTGGR